MCDGDSQSVALSMGTRTTEKEAAKEAMTKIALSQAGQFMRAANGGDDDGHVFFDRTTIGPHETFLVWQLSNGFVALETEKHRFLSHAPDGHWEASRARKSDISARIDLRNVTDDVISLPHAAWAALNWSDLKQYIDATMVEC